MLAADDITTTAIAFNLLLLLLLVVLSGVFSGSETILFSLTRSQIERHGQSSNPFRRIVPALMARPKHTLMTILVGNTAVNVLLFAVSYVFFQGLAERFNSAWITPLSGLGSILLVVVCGEVIPKVLGVTFADRLAPYSATIVRTLRTVAGPIGRAIDLIIAEPLVRLFVGARRRERLVDLSTSELKALLQMSRRQGDIDWMEDMLLREIIDLGTTRVREIMVPRVEVVAYDVNGPAEGLRDLIRRTRLKKIPIYDGSVDKILGVVYAKILFLNPDKALRALLQPVRYLPELATCDQALQHFRDTHSQLAIVVDEYGGVEGLVTLEDVLEEIVGEIREPEEGPPEKEIEQISEREYEISGRLDVRYWIETFGLPEQEERVATVGGLVTSRLGRPARVGDVIRLSNVQLQVIAVHNRRVERLRARLDEPAKKERSP